MIDFAALQRRIIAGGPIYVVGNADGRFELLSEFEPGAIDAEILLVRDEDLDSLEVFDAVAWERGQPTAWWTLCGTASFVGELEISKAYWEGRDARLVETPFDYLACHGEAFCILDWTADINAIIGIAPGVAPATPRIEWRLRQILLEQARPKIRITPARASVPRRAVA